MRRAILATVATVAGLVGLLDYKSSSTVSTSRVAVTSSAPSARPSSAPNSTRPSIPPTSTPPTGAPPTSAPPTTVPPTTVPAAPAQFTGSDVVYNYGDIQIAITVRGGKITNLAFPQESATDPRSQSINSQAIPILTQEALAAQSLNIDVVSGATYTSDAFGQALQSALTKAGK